MILERLSQSSVGIQKNAQSSLSIPESDLVKTKKAYVLQGDTTGNEVLKSLLEARKAFSVSSQQKLREAISS